jgi:hypothetical protein
MRSSPLVLAYLVVALTSCPGPSREWALPNDGATFPPMGVDGAAGTPGGGGTAGQGQAGMPAEAGTGGTGGIGSGTVDAADQPVDAEQPNGGCDPTTAAKTCVGDVLSACEVTGMMANTSCANGCSPARLECNKCRPNARACDGANLVVCNPEGTATTTMACTSGCDPVMNDCRACEPSAVWCAGDVLRECTSAGEPRDREVCRQGCNSARRACDACRPGTKSCSGNVLETCKLDGTGTTSETCSSGCNSARLACNACEPGTKMCAGSTLRTCRSDGSGWIDQSCPNGCLAERCNTCNPNQGRTCDGTSVRQCRGDGSGFELTPCARGCADGNCCNGNNEARGGSCSACGGNNQLCCEIASPRCASGLACQGDRCVIPKKPNGAPCNSNAECQQGNCAGGLCCAGGQHGCGGECVANSDATACGSTCRRCPEPERSTAICRSGSCDLRCDDGFMKNEAGTACVPTCGAVGQACCSGGTPCRGDKVACDFVAPDSGSLACVACGRENQPCCFGRCDSPLRCDVSQIITKCVP